MKAAQQFLVFVLVLMLGGLAGCAGGDKKESTGQFIDDATITARVKTAIIKDPTLKATQINVETYKGEVQLSGFVESQADRTRAAEVARSVPGVKAVRNDLRLR
jgi:osmotically-inducible protein OsmY